MRKLENNCHDNRKKLRGPEGFESGYDPEFVRFLKMARRSAGEVQSELYLTLDADFITQEELKQAYDLAFDIKKLINGMLSYQNKN